MDTILLAGDKFGGKNVYKTNKTLLDVQGIPSLIRVIGALRQVSHVQRIFIVGPAKEIEAHIYNHLEKIGGLKNIYLLQQEGDLIANLFVAYQRRNETLGKEQIEKSPLLVITGDIPLVTSEEIKEFIDNCDIKKYDYFLGIVPEKALLRFPMRQKWDGRRLGLFPLNDCWCRINNLHLIKPTVFKQKKLILAVYRYRYLQKVKNVLSLFKELVKRPGFRKASLYFFWIQLAIVLRFLGFYFLSELIRRMVRLERLETLFENSLGFKGTISKTSFGGAAIDIDSEGEFDIIDENYHKWMEGQKTPISH